MILKPYIRKLGTLIRPGIGFQLYKGHVLIWFKFIIYFRPSEEVNYYRMMSLTIWNVQLPHLAFEKVAVEKVK